MILVVFGTTGELIKLAPVLLRLDHVSNAKPHRLFVWRRLIFAAAGAAKADYRLQVLAHTLAIQTISEVRI